MTKLVRLTEEQVINDRVRIVGEVLPVPDSFTGGCVVVKEHIEKANKDKVEKAKKKHKDKGKK